MMDGVNFDEKVAECIIVSLSYVMKMYAIAY